MTRQSSQPFKWGLYVGFEEAEALLICHPSGFNRIVVHKSLPRKPIAERSLSDRPTSELCGGNHSVPYWSVVCDRSFNELDKPFAIDAELRAWCQSARELVENAERVPKGEWLFPDEP